MGLARRASRTYRLGTGVVRTLGLPWLVRRTLHAAQMRTGLTRLRTPAATWDELPLGELLRGRDLVDPRALLAYRRERASAFFFQPADRDLFAPLLRAWDASAAESVLDEADALVAGEFRYFSDRTVNLGRPPAWHRNPFTGHELARDAHWSVIGDFGGDDIKVVWEPSRFGAAYALVRAYWRTGDERYPECFWRLVESWYAQNPPQTGANWKCGQETTFRVMAWCFALHGFLDSPATTPERTAMLMQMIAMSGRRIEANIAYALNQQNNHGVSEGAGLFTIGTLFPEFAGADRWRERGRAILERLGRELVYDDGAFAQQSFNYQRLMLHDYLWSIRLGDIAGAPLSAELRARINASARLLWYAQDEGTGRVPVYGANDGALILPLDGCGYDDYRPVVQAVSMLAAGVRQYDAGPWDEPLLWLFGPRALEAPLAKEERPPFVSTASGYAVLRDRDSHVIVRSAERFRHRPSHADLLHVDLWWRGVNIAVDPGTCSYNDASIPDAGFDRTRHHNTLTVDGRDQMDRVSRFLWAPWATGRTRAIDPSTGYWEAEHHGYQRLRQPATHRRAVARLGGDVWAVADTLLSAGAHDVRLHWLLPDFPYELDEAQGRLRLETPSGPFWIALWSSTPTGKVRVSRAENDGTGWRSRRYGSREPALALTLECAAATTARFVTVFAPARIAFSEAPGGLQIAGPRDTVYLEFQSPDAPRSLAIARGDSVHDRNT